MAKLGIDRDFLREFAKLDKPVQDRVTEVFGKFEEATHAGVHLEKINHARDDRLRTIRVDQFWRGVVLAPESGDSYTLLKVLPHDDAYAWAKRRSTSVNRATGRIEIRDAEALEATVPALTEIAEAAPSRLFDHVKDSTLRQLGIDDQTLAFARALTDTVQLDAAKGFLPANQWDVLCGLAAGLSPEQVWAELGASEPSTGYDSDDVDAAVARSTDRLVLVDGPDELMAVFRHPLALWRIYLHPVQQAAVEASYRGPAKVSGGPGTGKTVVAMHRAHRLAQRDEGRVLLTTFTSTLADSLAAGIKLLATDSAVAERIDVMHVDRLAHRVFRERYGAPRLLNANQERQIWTSIINRLNLPFTDSFLAEEWRHVVLSQDISTAQDYLVAKRSGRGRPMQTAQRAQTWQAISEFVSELERRNQQTHETVCMAAADALRESTDKPYRHVVVDEAQDLSPWQWRLLRAAVPEAHDDIFLAGDPHQRIYNHRVSLRDVGISVAGRSTRLTLNYRTTAEILGWSLGLLKRERIDDMDGSLDSIAGCRSDVHGDPPVTHGYASKTTELAALSRTVRAWLDAGIEPEAIGVAARSNQLAEEATDAIRSEGMPATLLARGQPSSDSVVVGTMHRMKGLEFRCLAVIGVSDGVVPPPWSITAAEDDETTHRHDLQRERCLLFVACTRARENLSISWHGGASQLISALV